MRGEPALYSEAHWGEQKDRDIEETCMWHQFIICFLRQPWHTTKRYVSGLIQGVLIVFSSVRAGTQKRSRAYPWFSNSATCGTLLTFYGFQKKLGGDQQFYSENKRPNTRQ